MTEQTCKTIREALRAAQAALAPVAGEEAAREARLFFCHALGWDMARLLSRQTDIFPGEYEKMLGEMLARRLAGEPLQYILGEWELMGLPFRVDARALIPRQDTETLVEAALGLIKERGYRTVLDLCCGTGCIGISLAALSGAAVTLADISADALALARENAEKNGGCARFVETDLFSNIKDTFDLIACNPPYLSDADMAALQREVRFEPALALYGGADGLDFYRRIAAEYAAHLAPGGALLMEVGFGQAADVCAMFGKTAYAVRDLCGVERVVVVC
ncbi:MAG: peptide chain release factor N(5)-glutamine methyltransferase [Christensenella sp.]|nr:peptide chain release factor N(5)-glutamine methyltransferase [Christensenella sp.]